ncbi:uncharacterized protein CTHT_0057350 [Thermochaetoides thermophila DSM 1495]|uniref:Ribosome recycling factor domain-containing protein n=1 Tax=Chaetomium thermophilum (strain DSM 1495 / CBS 144.50 / IMI 039719) TaxID=759272 RepID=G0SCI5_CHATD|nr:hypothetical protein CTHT_0057350 [Thermochaetoides thermophila DSM 1495]EGS19111.1 hypothetical protein CTHT_0057350 [Thermochaetoides thermophila DSM 1495]
MRPLQAGNRMLRSSALRAQVLSRATPSLGPLIPTLQAAIINSTATITPAGNFIAVRSFSYTTPCAKKKDKASKDSSSKASSSSNNDSGDTPSDHKKPDPSAPYDFTDVTQALDRLEKRYLDELKKLRSGGRFNADSIGAIPVQLSKNPADTYPLRELATIAPLGGRRWSILAFEESSVKPIISAVLRAPEYNQQPQRSEENPLELTITVELEKADDLAKRAKEVCQRWRDRVREEVHKRLEVHKKWLKGKLIVQDDEKKLKEKLQKLQDERMKGIQNKEKEAVQQIMARGSQ